MGIYANKDCGLPKVTKVPRENRNPAINSIYYVTGDMIVSSPAEVDGVVYVGSYDHVIYAISLQRIEPADSSDSFLNLMLLALASLLLISIIVIVLFRKGILHHTSIDWKTRFIEIGRLRSPKNWHAGKKLHLNGESKQPPSHARAP